MKKFLASATTALLIAAGGVAITTTAANATPAEDCTPSQAWTETITVTPAIDEIPEVSHYEYQRYSWTGGSTETAPEEVPPSDNWEPNTTNYEGAGHGTDPIGVAFPKNPNKGGDWFFWTQKKVIDQAYVPGTPAETQTVEHPAVTCDEPEVPVTVPNALYLNHDVVCGSVTVTLRNVSPWIYPVTFVVDGGAPQYGATVDNRTNGKLDGPQKDQSNSKTFTFDEDSGTHTVAYRIDAGSEKNLYVGTPLNEWTTVEVDTDCVPNVVPPTNSCETGVSTHSTNLNELWFNVDTRSAGHYEYVENGLHIWTDDASSNAKVSLGQALSFPLHDTGVLGVDWTGTSPAPGLNLFVDFDGDTAPDGILVYEAVYGQDLWLTGSSAQFVKDAAPVIGGGNGSQWHGTIDQWLTKFPEAHVYGIAFALGSGVLGDGVINSITIACGTHTFDFEREVPEAPAPILGVDLQVDEAVCVEPLNGTAEIETWVRDYRIQPIFNEQTWVWEDGTEKEYTSDWYLSGVDVVDSEECAAVVVTPDPEETQTPEPEETSDPAPVAASDTLAITGGDAGPLVWFAVAMMSLGLIGVIIGLIVQQRGRRKLPALDK